MAIRERDLELDRKYAPPKAKDAGKLNDEGCDHLENGRPAAAVAKFTEALRDETRR